MHRKAGCAGVIFPPTDSSNSREHVKIAGVMADELCEFACKSGQVEVRGDDSWLRTVHGFVLARAISRNKIQSKLLKIIKTKSYKSPRKRSPYDIGFEIFICKNPYGKFGENFF